MVRKVGLHNHYITTFAGQDAAQTWLYSLGGG
jgi:hypothetical protein